MKRIKVIGPIPIDESDVSARAGQLPADFVRAGFQPEFFAELTIARGRVTPLNNIHVWRVRDAKFQEVYVDMSGANMLDQNMFEGSKRPASHSIQGE